MKSHFSTVMFTGMLLAACGQEEQILLPDSIEVEWDASYNRLADGLGAVVPVDIMVYDAASGDPLPGVELELQVKAPHAHLMQSTDVLPVVAPCSDCEVVWDAFRDEYYEMPMDFADEATRIRLEADESGLANFYVVVDAFSGQPGAYLAVQVRVESEAAFSTLYLQPR